MAYYGYPQANPALQNWYGQFYQPIQPPIQNPAMMQQTQQMQQVQQSQPGQQIQQPAIQQSGFVLVQSEQEARAYPVAPGNSITFKDESQPYCYVKTMGFNQLDRPTFERYRLVKEDSPATAQKAPTGVDGADGGKDTAYALKGDLTAIWGELNALKEKLNARTEKKSVKAQKATEETEASDNE